jgi:hypothetical protein
MKTFWVVAIFFVLNSAMAQDSTLAPTQNTIDFEGFKSTKSAAKDNLIKGNAFPFFFGQIPLTGEIRINYERMITHNQSLNFMGGYVYPNPILFFGSVLAGNGLFNRISLRGGKIGIGYRFYPLKNLQAPEGFYFGPYGSYTFARIKEKRGSDDVYTWHYANAGMIAGYQVKIEEYLYVDMFAGVGYRRNWESFYNSTTKKRSSQDLELPPVFMLPHKNVKLFLQFNLCYAF